MSDLNINQLDINQIIMYLLYAQSLEIQKLYSETITENTSYYLKYYLLPKNWLDNLKSKYNYSSIKQQISILDCIDFNTFQGKLLKNKKNNNNNNNFINEFNSIENNIEKKNISKYNINYLCNFVPVKQDIFVNLKLNINKDLLYDVIIGEENIFLFSNKNVFICSLNFDENNEEDISEFVVNVDAILILNDKKKIKERKKLINFISDNKGIKNYYKERNIDVNKSGEQPLVNKEGEKIGIFLKIQKNEENITPGEFLEEYINIIYQNENNISGRQPNVNQNLNNNVNNINNNINDNINNNINSNFNNNINNNINYNINNNNFNNNINNNINNNMIGQQKKVPKCITIKGDIYYYFRRNISDSNYSVVEFNNA